MPEEFEWFLSDEDHQQLQERLPELSDAQRDELLFWMRNREHDLPISEPAFGAQSVSADDVIAQIRACGPSHRKANGLLALRFLQLLREPEAEIPVGFRLTPAEEFYGLKPLPDWFGSTWFAEALRATGHEV